MQRISSGKVKKTTHSKARTILMGDQEKAQVYNQLIENNKGRRTTKKKKNVKLERKSKNSQKPSFEKNLHLKPYDSSKSKSKKSKNSGSKSKSKSNKFSKPKSKKPFIQKPKINKQQTFRINKTQSLSQQQKILYSNKNLKKSSQNIAQISSIINNIQSLRSIDRKHGQFTTLTDKRQKECLLKNKLKKKKKLKGKIRFKSLNNKKNLNEFEKLNKIKNQIFPKKLLEEKKNSNIHNKFQHLVHNINRSSYTLRSKISPTTEKSKVFISTNQQTYIKKKDNKQKYTVPPFSIGSQHVAQRDQNSIKQSKSHSFPFNTNKKRQSVAKGQQSFIWDANYLDRQPFVTSHIRMLEVDWLILISSHFGLKRQTLYLAVEFMDRFLAGQKIEQNELRLVSLTSLCLASKLQQTSPTLGQLIQISGMKLTHSQIKAMQIRMYKQFKYKIISCTLNTWMNIFTYKWDLFIVQQTAQKTRIMSNYPQLRKKIIQFRSPYTSHNYYRQFTSMLDCSLHQISIFKIKRKILTAGLLYLITRLNMQEIIQNGQKVELRYVKMKEQFKKKSTPLFKDIYGFNELFNEFLVEYCDMELGEIIPGIKLASDFIDSPINNKLHQALKFQQAEITYQQFLSYQLHSKKTLEYLLNVH